MTDAALLNQRGQKLGPKGVKTRQRIVDATRVLLETKPLRDISAMEIARASQTSVATFYIYFVDVLAAVLTVALELADASPDFTPHFAKPWDGPAAPAYARGFIEHYLDFFVRNYAVIRVRNHLADEGDTRFADIRSRLAKPIVAALSQQIATGGRIGDVVSSADDLSRAIDLTGLLLGMVDRLCTLLIQQPYSNPNLTRPRLVEAGAQIMVATVREFPHVHAGEVLLQSQLA